MLAIEKLMGLEVPLRAQYLRVLLGGADPHLQSHAEPGQSYDGRRRDDAEPVDVRGPRRLPATSSSVPRARACTRHWFRAGGVRQDVPLKLLTDIADWLDTRLPRLFEDAISLVADNRIFKQRNVDIARGQQGGCASPGASPAR